MVKLHWDGLYLYWCFWSFSCCNEQNNIYVSAIQISPHRAYLCKWRIQGNAHPTICPDKNTFLRIWFLSYYLYSTHPRYWHRPLLLPALQLDTVHGRVICDSVWITYQNASAMLLVCTMTISVVFSCIGTDLTTFLGDLPAVGISCDHNPAYNQTPYDCIRCRNCSSVTLNSCTV